MSEELKPCWHCGKIPRIVVRDVEPQNDPWYSGKMAKFVLCDCGICLFDEYFHEGFLSDDAAISEWNRRAADGRVRELEDDRDLWRARAERLEKACDITMTSIAALLFPSIEKLPSLKEIHDGLVSALGDEKPDDQPS